MKFIITNDIERECINMISAYLDTEFIKDILLQTYPNLSKSKQISVSENICFYINQGLELYAVSNTSINTIPLTLFYSLNNFVKASYLLHYPNLSISGSHGLVLKSNELISCKNLGEITIHLTNKGTFSNLLEITHDALSPTDTILLKDLFSALPELREIYFLLYSEEPNVFLLQGKQDDPSTYKVFFQSQNNDQLKGKNLTMLEENGYHLYTKPDYYGFQGYLSLTQNSWNKENNVIYYDSFGNKYCTTGINVGSKIIKPSKICNLYICYYVFSMLVRYHPDLWMKYCKAKEVSLISKLITSIKNLSLIEILQLMSNERYVFASKINDLERDIDYSELLKGILKEVEFENRQYGKSVLSDYI